MKRTGRQILSDGIKLLRNDIRSIKWALIFISVCFAFLEITARSICPMYALTGFPCPGCGLTRAGLQALRFHFDDAWRMNPFIFPIGALLAAYAVDRYIYQAALQEKEIGGESARRSGKRDENGRTARRKGVCDSAAALRLQGMQPQRRSKTRLRKWLDFFAVLILAGLIVFYIWRLIVCFPGDPPMTYNEHNLWERLFRAAVDPIDFPQDIE